MTPHEWLLEQIDVDRHRARAWQHDRPDGGYFYSCPATRTEPYGDLPYGEANCECRLEARRRRALIDCDAKEQIVRHHVAWQKTLREPADGWSDPGQTGYRMAMEWTTHRVAMMFDDRPGWADHWQYWPGAEPADLRSETT